MSGELAVKDVRVIALGGVAMGVRPGTRAIGPLTLLDDARPFVRPRGAVQCLLVEVEAEGGLRGFAQAGVYDGAAAFFLRHQLRELVLGQDAFKTNLLWEAMYRAALPGGRKGFGMAAISAVDIALWDLKAKALGRPLVDLLGGPVRDRIPVYASRLYANSDLEAVAAEARGYREDGFTAMKLRFGRGPRHGRPGLEENVRQLAAIRDAVGPDVRLMGDVYMGWDVPYCLQILPRLAELGLEWIEEPVTPDDLDGYRQVREIAHRCGVLVAGGEHEATRWGALQLLDGGCVDVLQPDVNRAGGITEAQRIWALAGARGVAVIPHAGQSHNYHLVAAHQNSPIAEYFPPPIAGPDPNDLFWKVWRGEPTAAGGFVELSDRPGLGIEPDWEFVDAHRVELRD